jgi:hypothetical protein
MALKSKVMGSYGRNAGEHRVRLLPNRAASARAQRFPSEAISSRGEIRTIAAMPHTWAVATAVVPVSELIGRDFEFEECGPDRRPSLDGADGDGQIIQPGLSEIVRHDHRAKARKVEGGARQRRPYVDVEDPGFGRSRPARSGPRGRRPRCSPTWPAWVRTWDFEAR